MPDKIYKCAECGRVITDKEYLSAVKGNKLKFCSAACDKEAWRRIHEYVKSFHKFKPAPPAPPEQPRKGYHMSEEERVEILEWAAKGYGIKQIAIFMGRSQSAVKNVIDNYVLVDADGESEDNNDD